MIKLFFSYSENVKTRSKILKDQPEKPLDKAMFWLEYVIRHKGAPHLKTSALALNWFQYLLLDVIALATFAYCATCYIMFITIKKIFNNKICIKNVTQNKKKN